MIDRAVEINALSFWSMQYDPIYLVKNNYIEANNAMQTQKHINYDDNKYNASINFA